MSSEDDAQAFIVSRLETLGTLEALADEIHWPRRGNGWDASKIAEAVFRVNPQPLDKLMRKAIRRKIAHRILGPLMPASPTEGLAGNPTLIYLPLWHVKGHHECFYLRDAAYKIRVDKDVVAVEVDGETRDLVVEEEAKTVPETFRRRLKRFSQLFTGERRHFRLDQVLELAVSRHRAEMYVTADGREGDLLDEVLLEELPMQRVFDAAQLTAEGIMARVAAARETKESVLKRFERKVVNMPETHKRTLTNTLQIEKLTQYYIPYVHFPVMRGGKVDHVIVDASSADIAEDSTVKFVMNQLGI